MLWYFLWFLIGCFVGTVMGTPLVEVLADHFDKKREAKKADFETHERARQKPGSELENYLLEKAAKKTDSRWLQRQIKYGKVSLYKVFDLNGNEIGEAYGEAAATELFKSRYKYWKGDVSMFIEKQEAVKEWGEVAVLNDKGELINTFEIDQARELIEIRPNWTIKGGEAAENSDAFTNNSDFFTRTQDDIGDELANLSVRRWAFASGINNE